MDAALLRELNYLGVDETTLAVLALLPLAQVAWADGEVQDAERETILQMADKLRLAPDSLMLLDGWLRHPPSEGYIERGRRAMLLLAQNDSGLKLDASVLEDVVDFAQAVAKAAGGFLGFAAVNSNEAEVLEQIAEALHVRDVKIPAEWLTGEEDEDVTDEATDVRSPEEMQKIREAAHIAAPQSHARTLAGDARGDLIHHGADGGMNFPMDEQGLTIGRSRTNDVQIPHDHGLSRLHCRIVCEDDKLFLVDNETTNGTFVNGERIVKRRLFGGEQIRVGESHFTFLAR